MTRSEITTMLLKRQLHWAAHDSAALAGAHSEDGVVQSPIFGTVTGRLEIEKTYIRLFEVFADWTYDIIVDGERVVQVFHVKASHTSELFGLAATGRRFEINGALLLTFKDGLIAKERRLYDFTSMLLQLGVLKAKPAT